MAHLLPEVAVIVAQRAKPVKQVKRMLDKNIMLDKFSKKSYLPLQVPQKKPHHREITT
jgi:hypothetical protein